MADDKKKQKKPAKKGASLATLEANGDTIELSKEAGGLASKAFIAGAVLLIAAMGISGGYADEQFQHSYLTAYMWALSISVGAVSLDTLQHLFGARASIVMRRGGEIIAKGSWVMALLAVPLLFPILQHNPVLYQWVDHHYMESNHALHSKQPWFNQGFFLARMAFYFGYFILMSRFWMKQSQLQEGKKAGDVEFYKKLQGKSSVAMILFALAVTFCAIDFLMTLDAIWFSTIFGVYYFATCVTTFHCTLVLTLLWFQKKGAIKKSVNQEHYHDLGKMMFAFVAFWSYVGFSQFMLIWYANIPEETHWFHMRLYGGWWTASILLAATHFVIPFFGMMSRSMKRHTGRLRFWAYYLLAVCWFDMYYLVAPEIHKDGMVFTPTDFLTFAGMAAMVVGAIVYEAKKVKLVATGDPRLPRALAFENI
jgi:hypothetical protein